MSVSISFSKVGPKYIDYSDGSKQGVVKTYTLVAPKGVVKDSEGNWVKPVYGGTADDPKNIQQNNMVKSNDKSPKRKKR